MVFFASFKVLYHVRPFSLLSNCLNILGSLCFFHSVLLYLVFFASFKVLYHVRPFLLFSKCLIMLGSLCFFRSVVLCSVSSISFKVSYYVRHYSLLLKCRTNFHFIRFLYPGQSGSGSKLKVSWKLLANLYPLSIIIYRFLFETLLPWALFKISHYFRHNFASYFRESDTSHTKASVSLRFFIRWSIGKTTSHLKKMWCDLSLPFHSG